MTFRRSSGGRGDSGRVHGSREFKSRPGHHVGPLPGGEGTRFISNRWLGIRGLWFAASAAGPRCGRLRNDADEADREAVLGSHFVLRAAVLAADVGPAGILAEVKDLGGAEELGASNALDRGVADKLGRLGHRIPSGFDRVSRDSSGSARVFAGASVGLPGAIVQRGWWGRS